MNNWPYSETVKDHFLNPRNFLRGDEVDFAADGVGEVGSPACGDVMKMWIKVKDEKIVDLKWKTFGCASAIGSTSMLSEMVLEKSGMKIKDALKITPDDILKRLGGLPQNKIHCSVLGDKALQAAIADYHKSLSPHLPPVVVLRSEAKEEAKRRMGKRGVITKEEGQSKTICHCLDVSERELDLAIAAGDKSFAEFQQRTKAGTGCGGCVEKIKKMMEEKIKEFPNVEKPDCSTCKKNCPGKH